MPLGIVSDEVFESEAKHIPIERGRGNTKEVPEVIREIVAEEAIDGTPAKDIAEKFGVSESSISAYKHGATSTATYHEPNQRLKKKTDEVRSTIIGTARLRLLDALSNITPKKLEEAKLRDVASVAKDMSSIINNMEPQITQSFDGAQFVFHVPQQKKESDYEVIDVNG